jgi:hypothetical protein
MLIIKENWYENRKSLRTENRVKTPHCQFQDAAFGAIALTGESTGGFWLELQKTNTKKNCLTLYKPPGIRQSTCKDAL